MRKFICGTLFGILLALAPFAYASGTLEMALFPVKLFVNGKEKDIPTEQAIFNHNGSAYVPLRFVSEALGAKVYYDGDQGTISISAAPYAIMPRTYSYSTAPLNGDIQNRHVDRERFMEFVFNTLQKKPDWIRIARETTDSGPLPTSVVFDGYMYHYFVDYTQSSLDDRIIYATSCNSIESVKGEDGTSYRLTECRGKSKTESLYITLKD
jgi:hypothetical protein